MSGRGTDTRLEQSDRTPADVRKAARIARRVHRSDAELAEEFGSPLAAEFAGGRSAAEREAEEAAKQDEDAWDEGVWEDDDSTPGTAAR